MQRIQCKNTPISRLYDVLTRVVARHPHRGQGAVSSIEDAATLGVLFNGSAEPSIATWSVEAKLQLFGDIRQKRVSAIQIMSEVPLFEDTMAAKKAELMQYLPESELPGEIFYYKRCLKDNTSATTFRRYLKNKYRVLCNLRKAKANVNTKAILAALFIK
jgi:2-polyprenyl-6-methoxyphenol hydroxylase-like FAD-dependent oxidoreductase